MLIYYDDSGVDISELADFLIELTNDASKFEVDMRFSLADWFQYSQTTWSQIQTH